MASLTFYGGIGQIGGNIIQIEQHGQRLFLDFGKNFEGERRFFDPPYLMPREEKHLLPLGLLPDIEGVYKKDARECAPCAVLLSHAHADHMGYVCYLKDEIPIYSSVITRDTILAREESGRSVSREYEIAALTARGPRICKTFNVVDKGQREKVGPYEVEFLPVDHSVRGASAIVVYAGGEAIVYTGDFRYSSSRAQDTQEFVEHASRLRPGVLIIEGTNITRGRLDSEEDVQERLERVVRSASGLVMAGFSAVDVDRLDSFYAVARATGRVLAISMKQAYILLGLGSQAPFELTDPSVAVFQREKKTKAAYEKVVEETGCDVMDSSDVSGAQDRVVLVAGFYDMNETITLQPAPGSVYILSQSEPFNEEMELDFNKLMNWLELYGVPMYAVHASGHASPFDLKETVKRIGARRVFLVHTERPALYQRFLSDIPGQEALCPEYGTEIQLG